MTGGRDDRAVRVRSVSGEVTVVGSHTEPDSLGDHGPAEEESPSEQTRPLPRMSRLRLALHGWRHPVTGRRRRRMAAQALGAVALVALAAMVLRDQGAGTSAGQARSTSTSSTTVTVTATVSPTPTPAQEDPAAVAPRTPSTQEWDALPVALVGSTLDVPADPDPGAEPGTTMLHPADPIPVYAAPGGPAVARLPEYQLLAPTWVPVIDRRPGWAQVLLPARPTTGGVAGAAWVHLTDKVHLVDSDRRIEIDTAGGAVTVLAELARADTAHPDSGTTASTVTSPATGRVVGRTFVAIGGRSLGAPWFLRLVLASGAAGMVKHTVWPFTVSTARLCAGPLGGVAIPGLPTTSGLGALNGAGCVATPEAVREALHEVPTGTMVLLR
jgi:hypothetical protein